MLESIFNETVAISTAQHQICLIALPPDFQVGQARPLSSFCFESVAALNEFLYFLL